MLLNTFQSDGIMGDLIAQTITKCNCCRIGLQATLVSDALEKGLKGTLV